MKSINPWWLGHCAFTVVAITCLMMTIQLLKTYDQTRQLIPPPPPPPKKKNTKGEGEGRGDTTKHVFLPLQEKQMIFMLEMLLFCQLVFTWFNTSIKK